MKCELSRAVKNGILSLGLVLSLWCGTSSAVDVVNENPQGDCRSVELFRELNVFKDPTLFMSDLGLIYVDPTLGWKQLMRENPLLTQLKGRVQLVQLGPAREFKNFGAIAKLYEAAEPRLRLQSPEDAVTGRKRPVRSPMIVPIEICGSDAYSSTLGFVLEQDLKRAQQYDQRSASLPPSVYPNPIPRLKNDR